MTLTTCLNSKHAPVAIAGLVLAVALQAAACAPYVPPATVPPAPQPQLEPFRAAIKSYLDQTQNVRKDAAQAGQSVPNQGGAAPQAEEGVRVREQRMAAAIRTLRPEAQPGSLLTADIAAVLTEQIAAAFASPRVGLIRDELEEQTEGRSGAAPQVNQPSDAPRIPPVLLSQLPALPQQLEFDFSGRALILRDVDANIVVDFVPNALPEPVRQAQDEPSTDAPTTVGGGVLPVPSPRGSVVFAAMGDNGSGDRAQLRVAEAMQRYFTESRRFSFVIMLGDNLYHDDYTNEFLVPYKGLLDSGVQFYAALGNHDRDSEIHFKPFNMDDRPYYAFNKGNIRFAVLDSNQPRSVEQMQWFDKIYGDDDGRWRIAYFHHPPYSSGQHSGQGRDEIRPALEPALVRNKVNVAFAGHEHLYERVAPQQGVRYFVSGGGGRRLYGVRRSEFDEVAVSEHHFMVMSVSGDKMFFESIAANGRMLDCGLLWRTPEAETKGPTPEDRVWVEACQSAVRVSTPTDN